MNPTAKAARAANESSADGMATKPPRGRNAGATRARILDAAERQFSTEGYEGSSIRDIADAADVQVALVAYHFGSKDGLFDAVLERRATEMGKQRMEMLVAVRSESGNGQPLPIASLIEAYVWPFVERASNGGPGWRCYTQLIGRMSNSHRWGPVINRHYDDIAREFVDEFARAMPEAGRGRAMNAFAFMVGTMLVACSDTGRIERLSKGDLQSPTPIRMFADMMLFLEAGIRAVARLPGPQPMEG